jgi:hypothetical protein
MRKGLVGLTVSFLLVALLLDSTRFARVNAQEEPVLTDTQNNEVEVPAPTWNLDLTVSPVSINIETEPGIPTSSEVKVKNNAVGPEYLKIDIAKFQADETGARPEILDLEAGDTFADWLLFSEQMFVVNPGEWKSITVTFSPPEDAALGYYITLIFNRQQINDPNARQTVITGAPAILMLANVNTPNAKKELQFIDFSTDKSFYEYLPVNFTVTVKNSGNIHVVPSGNIFIDRGGQKDIDILSVNAGGSNILSESERLYEVEWSDGFPVWGYKDDGGDLVYNENGEPVKKLVWDFENPLSKFRIGKYTAHLLMVYDNGERDVPIEASVSFWVIPYKLIIVLVLVALLPAFFVYLVMKARYRKMK